MVTSKTSTKNKKDIPEEEIFTVKGEEVISKTKELINEGNVRRLIIKDKKGKTILSIPVFIGLVGAVIAPWLAILGTLVALGTECTITVIRKPTR